MVYFKKGTCVKIKPKFSNSKNELKMRFRVIEDRGDRILIEEKNSKLSFKPQETVKKIMVSKCKKTIF